MEFNYKVIWAGLILGLSMIGGSLVYAQVNSTNGTVLTTPQLVGQVTENTITTWTTLLGLIVTAAMLVLKHFGLDQTRYGKGLTFLADLFHAAYDQRKTIGSYARIGADIAPEEAKRILTEEIVPLAKEMNRKADELIPKIREATELAAANGKAVESINYGKKFSKGDMPALVNR